MNPLLALIPQLIPQLAKLLGGEHSGRFQEQAIKAIEDRTGVKDREAAEAKINTDMAVKQQLQNDLEEIALEELKERNRASEEAGRIDLELYRMEADERDHERAESFELYKRDSQDRREARAMQMHLEDEYNPLAWVAPILALSLVLMVAYLLRGIMLAREPVINKDVFNVVLGALVTAFTTVIAYYFGSSLGSTKKDEAVRKGTLVTNQNQRVDPAQSTGQSSDGGTRTSIVQPNAEAGSGQTGDRNPLSTPKMPTSGPYRLFRQKAPVIMRNLVRDLGLTDVQAAGMLGNIGWECGGFNLLQEQRPIKGGRGGLGWCQWTASRRLDFERWLAQRNADYQNDDANYNFLLSELHGSQKASLAALKRANSLEAATSGFMNAFERPAASYAHLNDRIKLANLALQDFRRA